MNKDNKGDWTPVVGQVIQAIKTKALDDPLVLYKGQRAVIGAVKGSGVLSVCPIPGLCFDTSKKDWSTIPRHWFNTSKEDWRPYEGKRP